MYEGDLGGQQRWGEPRGQDLAHGESTGLILRGSRADGIYLAFVFLASCKTWLPTQAWPPANGLPNHPQVAWHSSRSSGPVGCPPLLMVFGTLLWEAWPPPLLACQLFKVWAEESAWSHVCL